MTGIHQEINRPTMLYLTLLLEIIVRVTYRLVCYRWQISNLTVRCADFEN